MKPFLHLLQQCLCGAVTNLLQFAVKHVLGSPSLPPPRFLLSKVCICESHLLLWPYPTLQGLQQCDRERSGPTVLEHPCVKHSFSQLLLAIASSSS